jgi:hypothetical protein
MTEHRAWIAGTAWGLGLGALVGVPVLAQEDGGLQLTFGLSARVESVSNPGLTVPAEPTRERLSSRLSFGLTDTTRTGSVALSAAGTVSADNDDESADGLIDPDLRLSVKRIGATSSLELSAFLRESDLDTLRGLVLDPDTGEITEDVLGNGTRRQTGGRLVLSFGDRGPWGGTLAAGLTDTTFSGTTSEADNSRTNLDGTLRFDLDPATEVAAGLSWSRYEEEGDDPRDTLRPELSIRRDRPAGFVSASVFAEDTEDGTRAGLSIGRSWELPDNSFAFSFGATRGVTGDLSPTGRLTWQRDLPRGNLSASLRHDVTSGDDDQETIITTASLGLSQSISPLSSLNFGLNASDSEDTATDLTTRNASLSATYSHSLSQDWNLDAGVTHRIRNEDDSGEATSDTVFLELRRAFEWRP